MTSGKAVFLTGVLLLAPPANAAPGDINIVRDLAARIGPIIGSASACEDIARHVSRRSRTSSARLSAKPAPVSPTAPRSRGCSMPMSPPAASWWRRRKSTARARNASLPASSSRWACSSPSPQNSSPQIRLLPVTACRRSDYPRPPLPRRPPPTSAEITDREIRFGMVLPSSGARKEAGRQMKIGIEAAFNRANDAGGINGRTLRLVTADDGYEPSRT